MAGKKEAADDEADVMIITLAELQQDYGGQLASLMDKTGSEDVLIRLVADIEVSGQPARPFAAVLAVSYNYLMAEPLADIAEQLTEEDTSQVFAWVPAHLYGSDDFAIYIAEHGLGDNLANGMIGEIVRLAAVEEALEARSGRAG